MAERLLRAVAYATGDVWVVQGVDYDVTAQTNDPLRIPEVFLRAFFDRWYMITKRGGDPMKGLKPAPERFLRMFERAELMTMTAAPPSRATGQAKPPGEKVEVKVFADEQAACA